MQTRGSIRKFVCKRCGKDAQDLQGGFTQYSKKFETNLVYENIDLCDKCFKITTREQKNLTHLQTAIELGVINKDDIETLKKFQTDKHFRKTVLENLETSLLALLGIL